MWLEEKSFPTKLKTVDEGNQNLYPNLYPVESFIGHNLIGWSWPQPPAFAEDVPQPDQFRDHPCRRAA
jgi:hypothetical protein